MQDELVIRGSLEESGLPELLRSICKSKESGILTCNVYDFKKSIYIDHGLIIFASSTDLDDRLGESLLRNGRITVRSFLDATKGVRLGRRLGALLCENNSITPEELVEGVRTQVRDIIISLFDIVRGTYELTLKEIETHEMILLNSSTEDIIFDGIQSIRSWSRISKGIGSFAGKLLPGVESEKVVLNLSLAPEESHIYSLCEKGRFNVEEICGMSYLSNFETCRILWGMIMVGALEVMDMPERVASGEDPVALSVNAESDLHDLVENYNDLFSLIYDFAFGRMGEEADMLTDRAMLQVQKTMPNLAKGLKLDSYGRLDFDSILRNLMPIPENGRMGLVSGALEEIVYALLDEVGSSFGSTDQKSLMEQVQKMKTDWKPI